MGGDDTRHLVARLIERVAGGAIGGSRSGQLPETATVISADIALEPLGNLPVRVLQPVTGDPVTNALVRLSMGLPLMAFLLIGFGMFVNLGCLAGTQGENKYGGPPGSGGGYTPSTPAAPSSAPTTSAAAAASSLFGASAAIDRAIAEKGRAAAPQPQPQMQAPRPRPAPVAATLQPAPAGGAPSFGRRAR